MKYETLLFNKEDGVCILTLNRPRRLNAMSYQLGGELGQAVDEIERDDEIKVAIITGTSRPDGRGCFSAGADLKERATACRQAPALLSVLQTIWTGERLGDEWYDKVESVKKITIAAIDGVCSAGGLELALCCDLRVVAETAQVSDLHIKNLGVIGSAAITVRLARAVGAAKAKEMAMTGDPIDGREAWRIGLANQVFPTDKLLEGAKELAHKIARMNLAALIAAKTTIDATHDLSYRQALRYADVYSAALGSVTEAAKTFSQGHSATASFL